ncbi:MAG: DUF2029 domain-containing protein [Planctomycetes bacterium]|nr:DUF2029 domain-containing protein [Planctomycetota bacterium]
MSSIPLADHTHQSRKVFNRDLVFVVIAAVVVSGQLAFGLPPIAGPHQDFCIFHAGVGLAWNFTSPYDLGLVETTVSQRLGIEGGFPCGFFLPPLSFVVLAPFAILPWPIAEIAWVATLLLGALASGSLAWTFGRQGPQRGWGVIVATVLLCPLVQRSISLGQSGLFICACVALGQWAFERRRPLLGSLLWGLTGLKPQLALPLLVAAGFVGGWRRSAGIGAVIALLWTFGTMLIGEPLGVTVRYAEFLRESHKTVGFNRITNDQIVSWNRLVVAVGGPAIELGSVGVVVGVCAALGFIWWLRIHRQPQPPESWTLAVCVAWGLFTAGPLGYDLVLLTLMAPYLFRLHDRGYDIDLVVLLGAIAVISIPRELFLRLGNATNSPDLLPFILSYRSVALSTIAVYLLLQKPRA